MLYRKFTDLISSVGWMARVFSADNPDEKIHLATAATFLESEGDQPVGWSLRRNNQRRGVVFLTNDRVVFKANTISLMNLFYVGWMLLLIWLAATTSSWSVIVVLGILIFGLYIFQRRPFTWQAPFNSMKSVNISTVRGIVAKADLLTISMDKGHLVNIALSQRLPNELKYKLSSQEADQEESA